MGNEASLEGEGLPEGLAAAAGGAGGSGSALHPGIPAGMEADLSQLSEEERRQIAAVMSRAQGLPKGSVPAAAAESPSMHRHAQHDGEVQTYIYRFPCTKQELDSSQSPKQPRKPPDPGRPAQPGLSKSRTTDTFRPEQKLPGRRPSTISLKESKSRTDFKEEHKPSLMPGFFSDVNPLSAVSSVVNKFNPFDLISDSEASQEETTRKQKVAQKDQGKSEGITKPPLQQPSPKSVPKQQGPVKEGIQQDPSPKSASSQQAEKIKPQAPSTGKPSQASSQPPQTDQTKLPIEKDTARPQTKPSEPGKPSQQSPAKTPAQQASPGKSAAQQPGPAKATVQQPGPTKSPAQPAGTVKAPVQPPVTSKPSVQQAGVEKTSSQQPGPKPLNQTPGPGKIPPGPVKSPAQQPGTAKLPAQQTGPQPPAKVPGPTKTPPAQQSGPGKTPAQQPGPAKSSPQQPVPAKLQPQPQQPTPVKPQPQQPAPTKPPQQTAPAKPQPQQPTPAKPQPQQPAPAKPSAQQPAPAKPSAQQQPMKPTSQTVSGRPLQPPPTSAAQTPGQDLSKTICPLCNTTELLLHSPEKANFNTCTECQTTVCSLCGFNPNPHLTEIKEWLCLNCQMQRALGGELAPIPSSPKPSPKAASVPPTAAASKPPVPSQPASPKKEPPPKQDSPKAPESKKPPPLVKQPTLHGPTPATTPKPPVAEALPEPAPPKEPSASLPEKAKAPVADVKPKQPKTAEPRADVQSSAVATTRPDVPSSQVQPQAQVQTAPPLKTDSAKPSHSFPPTGEKTTPSDSKAMPRPASDSKIISHPGHSSESKDPKHVDPTHRKEEPKKAQIKMSPKPDAKPVPKGSPTPSGPRPTPSQAAPPSHQPLKPQEQPRRFSLNLGSITDAPKSQPTTPQETVTGKLFGFGASIFSQASNLISTAGQPGPHPQTGPAAPTKQAPTPSQTPAAPKPTGQLPPAPAKAPPVKKETKAPSAESLESKPEQAPAAKRLEKDKKPQPSKVSKPPPAEPDKTTKSEPTCPLCKTELNIGSQDPPNFNTCTQCKSQVCNLCGFNPKPHLTERTNFDIAQDLEFNLIRSRIIHAFFDNQNLGKRTSGLAEISFEDFMTISAYFKPLRSHFNKEEAELGNQPTIWQRTNFDIAQDLEFNLIRSRIIHAFFDNQNLGKRTSGLAEISFEDFMTINAYFKPLRSHFNKEEAELYH
ncbi:Protein piccolo [Microtus ochrogaster]|uniref:Protein piccolo n=1 Tax=Microtus ochrogaster TaxID=79684 RepID=A0A8J6L888_MICOH|nr:Protein piccolo [Microtus ochrogaster]